MYEPMQIPYLLNSPFQEQIQYREYHFRELSAWCMCIWEMKSQSECKQAIDNEILPDACIDIVIDFTSQFICFSGFSKETEHLTLSGKVDYLGVRMKPGAFYALFHVNADQVMDHMIPFTEIETTVNPDLFFHCEESKRIELFRHYLGTKCARSLDHPMIRIVDRLYHQPSDQTVSAIAADLGYNQRQLIRIFKRWYGISPKVLLNILRLHLSLKMMLEDHKKLCDIAVYCGFYDQSHFIKEMKRYISISPLQLLDHQ